MNMNMMINHEIMPMLIIGIVSGLLSSMNIWIDKVDDIRFSINDCYMSVLMTGWMFLLYGIYYKQMNQIYVGIVFVVLSLIAIRTQFLIDKPNFIDGMIPHHSMAIFMSKKLKEKNEEPELNKFLDNIINAQSQEIIIMKNNEI
ncbi:arginine ADP-ribosyltransferase [Bodo saltans virus]|uniref:Arginine ADP-ribosyltransferase n=1 Tax=Bodo saltans virus TaxID=2024608 RepID=A0A2H4UWA4_9VIRU|nr:arginine ADP-ribosyltransferase [Bodo saltans virus]ATZ81115.1 arginine ADP-ribosyltransferase [Bodo saltans virus]